MRGQEEGARAATTLYTLAVGAQATHLSYWQFPVSVLAIKLNFLHVQVFPLVVYYSCSSYYLAFWVLGFREGVISHRRWLESHCG